MVMPSLGWRWLLALSAVPSSFLLVFYSKAPESPRYLCLRGRTDDALHILQKIAIVNQTELPSSISLSDHQATKGTKVPSEDAHLLSPSEDENEASDNIGSDVQTEGSIFMLLSPNLLRSTLLLWAVFFGSAFSYYGLVLLTTELSSKNGSCTGTHLTSTKSADVSYQDVFIASFAGTTLDKVMLGSKNIMLSSKLNFTKFCLT